MLEGYVCADGLDFHSQTLEDKDALENTLISGQSEVNTMQMEEQTAKLFAGKTSYYILKYEVDYSNAVELDSNGTIMKSTETDSSKKDNKQGKQESWMYHPSHRPLPTQAQVKAIAQSRSQSYVTSHHVYGYSECFVCCLLHLLCHDIVTAVKHNYDFC